MPTPIDPALRQSIRAAIRRMYPGRFPALEAPAPEVTEPPPTEPVPAEPDQHVDEPLLTAAELQSLTSIAQSWWLAEARADRIPHVRAGKYVRFVFADVVRHLRERSRQARLH